MADKSKIRDVTQLIRDAKQQWSRRIQKGKWGHWQYNPDDLTLDFKKTVGGHHIHYWVDLDRCTNSAQILDWIFQINGKSWCTGKDIADLLRAFDDLMQLVQSKICSGGVDHKFDTKKYLLKEVNPLIKKSSN